MSFSAVLKAIFTYFHPVLMWVLFAMCLYALYLGLQVRKTRLAQGDVRKQLVKGRFNLRHHQVGAILLSMMVLGSLGGIGVTYVNNGKLFVGPHLIAGLSMTGLVAIAASLSPFMQRGSQMARNVHIAVSAVILGLFAWEAVTGMEIVQRIMNQS
ncbi:MAG: DUF4079 domain-containing protein [Thermosynechococcaceae cyanobacterium]